MTASPADAPPGLANFRDLGGLDAGRSGTTAHGVLYRSDAPFPHDVDRSPDGAAVWPPAAVVDLRSVTETADTHPLSGRSAIHRIPLSARAAVLAPVSEAPASETRASETPASEVSQPPLDGVYREILAHSAGELASIIGLVARADGPVLIHCGAGKDRTGIAVAVLLLLAGVPRESIVADYAATAPRMPLLIDRLTAMGRTPRVLTRDDPASLAAPAARIEAVLDHVEANPDGVAGWAMDNGAGADDIAAWRRRFVLTSSPAQS